MPDKKLYQMGSRPTGGQVFSMMKYMMLYHPDQMVGLYHVYDDDINVLEGWLTGFAYAFALVEDCGMPVDIDDALHNWDWEEEGESFDMEAAVKSWIAENKG